MTTKPDKFLPFTDDFIFSLVMQDPEICRELLNRILPEEEFGEIKLDTTDRDFLYSDSLTAETQ